MENIQDDPKTWWSRNIIALIITGFVMAGTVLICIYCLFMTIKPNLDFVGQSLLPLWGTWFGTVLAFYFGKANFEAAAKSYQEVIKTFSPEEKIAKLSVEAVMIHYDQIEHLDYELEKDKNINEILKYQRFKAYNRYAIFNQNHVLRCIIHRSAFYQFIAQQVETGKDNTFINGLKLCNIIDDSSDEIKSLLFKGHNFVKLSASLLEAKNAMDAIPECQDVFVTDSGKANEPVLGLITNNLIMEKAKV
jgi:hypothetical protein